MSRLFGDDNYHGYVGAVRKPIWKKDLRKIIKYIRKSIELSVDADSFHKNRLITLCNSIDNQLSNATLTSQMNLIAIEGLIELAFLLIGNIPDHWRRKSPYSDKFWGLDGHRRLTYSQSNEQKTYLIIHIVDIRREYTVEVEGYEDLHAVFYRKFKGKAHEFISWFKKNYPNLYCKIF